MDLLIACSSRGRNLRRLRAISRQTSTCALLPMSATRRRRLCAGLVAAAGLLKTLPNLQLIVSVGAGVDHLFSDPDLPDVPIVRFVDPDLTGRMVEYVALHVLYHHRRMSEFRELQARKVWKYSAGAGRARGARRADGAGRAGLGRGQRAQGLRLSGAGLEPVAEIACRRCLPCRRGELDAFLAETDILAVLLPLTPQTRARSTARSSPSCRVAAATSGCRGPC
jgi:glyoxylate/hydroxypyruvate reductase A